MHSDRGFTIVEVLVAAFITIVGLLGMVAMIDAADLQTSSTKAREAGVNLQREIVEIARSVPYDQLVHASVVDEIASRGFDDARVTGDGWKVNRRGVVYTVSVGVCSVDDARDGTGPHDAGLFCSTGAGATTPAQCRALLRPLPSGANPTPSARPDCGIDTNGDGAVDGLVSTENPCAGGACPTTPGGDSNPDDYKRIVTLVRWDRGTGVRYAIQTATVPNPGLSSGPGMRSLTVTSQSDTSASFQAITTRPPATVSWTVDGEPKGTASGTGTQWAFTWAYGTADETRDGTYVVGARATNSYGVNGQVRAVTIKLNRRIPPAPTSFVGGRNPGPAGEVIEFEWLASIDGDVEGYEVREVLADGSLGAVACSTTGATQCMDTSPPAGNDLTYKVVALDRDDNDALRRGTPSSAQVVTLDNPAPGAPDTLRGVANATSATLQWNAPVGTPAPSFYRIYRDGERYADRLARTGGAETTFTDGKTNGEPHVYRVTAVTAQLAESDFSNAWP